MELRVSPEIAMLVDEAAAISARQGTFYVGVEHLFEAVLTKCSLLPDAISKAALNDLNKAAEEMRRDAWQGAVPMAGSEIFHTPRCAAVLNNAIKLSERLHCLQATAGHLLLAILVDSFSGPSRAMDRLKMDRGGLIERLRADLVRNKPTAPSRAVETGGPASEPVAKRVGQTAASEPKGLTLDAVTTDLTQLAREGKLHKAIGRSREITQVLQILARQNKNNAILTGEAGVGKTRIVEGLAVAMVRGYVGDFLDGYRLLELNLGALLAGTQYRGAFEEKLMGLVDELKKADNIILFIDEIHMIMGAGATDGDSMDVANLLKPALARGEVRCIGATTLSEYRKFIERDPAIERRFQMLRVEPLSPSDTRKVLSALAPSLERHHGVRISKRAMASAITLTERYLPNRQFPDKAIDVLDQACARVRLKASRGAYAQQNGGNGRPRVTPDDVRKTLSQMAAIPIEEMTAEERARLIDLDGHLRRRIVGQDEAIAKTVSLVKKSRVGLADPDRPDAVMLFLGPTGVGKTQLAKELARSLFGSSKHLISFDMTEYGEAHSVTRLIGAPPGYVGYDEEGQLTGAIKRSPFSIILFDEIEKAHPRVFDLLLPILDEGRLKDSKGTPVSFKNCIIIFTSNIGSELLVRSETRDQRSLLLEALREHFRPEFINRIDEVVPFYPLLFEDVRSILKQNIDQLRVRLIDRRIGVRMYQRAYERLAEIGYNPEFGARELRRTVEQMVTNPVSDMLLRGEFIAEDMIEVLIDDNDDLTIRKGKPHSHPHSRRQRVTL